MQIKWINNLKNILHLNVEDKIDHKFEMMMEMTHRVENLNKINNMNLQEIDFKLQKYEKRK